MGRLNKGKLKGGRKESLGELVRVGLREGSGEGLTVGFGEGLGKGF